MEKRWLRGGVGWRGFGGPLPSTEITMAGFSKEPDGRGIARAAIRVSKFRVKESTGEDHDGMYGKRGKKDEDQYSPAFQLEHARRYCDYMGLTLDVEASVRHQDLNVSAFRKGWRERSDLMEHYRDAQRGDYQHLIFYKLSRLGRNVRESLDLIDAFEKCGVTIHIVKENIDCSTAQGRCVRNILLAVAEMQSEDISEFIIDAILERARQGGVQHGAVPAWIRPRSALEEKSDDGSPLIGAVNGYEVIEEQVENIRRLVALRMEGNSYIKIARNLNDEGRLTVKGRWWTDGMVFKYLSPTWIDTMEGTGYIGRDKPEGDPNRIVIPHLFPPILSPEEAAALRVVQKRYTKAPLPSLPIGGGDWQTNKARRNGRYSADTRYLLASIIFCSRCGARLLSKPRGDGRPNLTSYMCPRARSNAEAHQGAGIDICAANLEDAVLRVVRKVLLMPPPPPPKPPDKPRGGRGLEQINREIDRIVTLCTRDVLDEEDFTRKYQALQQEKAALIRAEEEEAAPTVRAAAKSLLEGEEVLTREKLRQLVLLLVKRVEAPFEVEGVMVRPGLKTLRRFARVTLHEPMGDGTITFVAPIYTTRYQGSKQVYAIRIDGKRELLVPI